MADYTTTMGDTARTVQTAPDAWTWRVDYADGVRVTQPGPEKMPWADESGAYADMVRELAAIGMGIA